MVDVSVRTDVLPGSPKLEARIEERANELKTTLVLSGVLALFSFLVHLAIAWRFERLGLYFFNDVLFGSDTHDFLASISHGERSVRVLTPDLQNSVHPYVWFYFSPFVRGLAKFAVLHDITRMTVFDARLLIGILVVPLVGALQCVAFGLLLHLLGLRTSSILLISLLGILSFSSLIYGSIPDHFALTNFAVTAIVLAAVATMKFGWTRRLWLWFPLGCLAAGITITNVAFLGIAHFFARLSAGGRGFWKTGLRSGALAVFTFLFVLLSADMIGFVMHGAPETAVMHKDFVGRYVRAEKSVIQGLDRTVKGIGNAIAPAWQDVRTDPAPPLPEEQYPVTRPPLPDASIYPAYSLEIPLGVPPGNRVLSAVALAAAVVGGIVLFARGGLYRSVSLTCAAMLMFNLAFHNIWGDEFLLYSQHWMMPYLLLCSGLFLLTSPVRIAIAIGTAVFIASMTWNNAAFIHDLMAVMAETAAAANLFVD